MNKVTMYGPMWARMGCELYDVCRIYPVDLYDDVFSEATDGWELSLNEQLREDL